jgi:predicted Fe-Mo cluster-binding NifX family protein
MNTFICAFGTDDGKHFTNRHFGDSNRFDIYELTENKISFIKQIENNSVEETTHADPKKAGSIVKILKAQGVQIVFSKQFGPNIKRIKKNFVCVRVHNKDLDSIKELTTENISLFDSMWNIGEERGFITQQENVFKIINL